MKIFIRIIRVILGLALLAAFAFGLYTFAQAAPKSGDYLAFRHHLSFIILEP